MFKVGLNTKVPLLHDTFQATATDALSPQRHKTLWGPKPSSLAVYSIQQPVNATLEQ
jgi:hypothetical protein